MKRITTLLASLAILPCAAWAGELDIRDYEAAAECGASATQVAVTVTGVTKPEGILTVELYRPSKGDFLKKKSRVHRVRVPAQSGAQTICFDIPAAGDYAVATYHDIDADRDLDQKWNGMPKEPFGLSTNEKLKLGFPSFYDADFPVPEGGTAITIALVN